MKEESGVFGKKTARRIRLSARKSNISGRPAAGTGQVFSPEPYIGGKYFGERFYFWEIINKNSKILT